jgi:glycosyl transferase family 87
MSALPPVSESARARFRVAAIAACLLVLTALILFLARPSLLPAGVGSAKIQPIELVALAWVVFGCAVWLARKAAVKTVIWLILAGGITLQVAALAGPPQNSSDLYRYIWDGRVQAAGIDPYLYAPGAAGVARLRNDFLWSPKIGKHTGYWDCVGTTSDHSDPADDTITGCTKINRPSVPTVYPPVAEAYFTAIQLADPADDSARPVQAAAGGFAVLITALLLFGLRRKGKDPRLAALWAWCPTVALEAGQNGHVDVVGVALAASALLLLASAQARKRKILGGVLLGLAIATKVTPVLTVPGVLRRGWREICAAIAATVAIVYVPHVIAVGSKIIGFFPGYLNQEGYSNGNGFSIIGLFVTGKAATAVAVVILGAIAVAIVRFGDPAQPWRGGVLMTSAALAVCTPHYQWYAILLVMLVALDGRPEWLAIAAGGYLSNNPHLYIHGLYLHDPRLVGYGGGAAVACTLALLRLALSRRPLAALMPWTARLPWHAGEGTSRAAVMDALPAALPPAFDDTTARETTADDTTARDTTADAAEEVPVLEPTAVLHPTITIGVGGKPDFSARNNSH